MKELSQPNSVTRAVDDYIKKIRNPFKREYAKKYYAFQCHYLDKEPEPTGLGFMGAQAVRIAIREIYGQANIIFRD